MSVIFDANICRSVNDNGGASIRSWKNGRIVQREKNVLGNCSPVPGNGACVDNKYNRLCVIEVVSVLDPDARMSGDVHGLDGVFHVW